MPMSTRLACGLFPKDRLSRPRDDVLDIARNDPTATWAGIDLVRGTGNRYPVILAARTGFAPRTHRAAQALHIEFGMGLPIWTL